ncbi:hypothetical protein V8D89_008411 [Ganoderma adspersum]
MSTSSVFPLEIYEHILELYMEDEPSGSLAMLYSVCHCRALGFRCLMFADESVDMMHLVGRKMIANPHLAEFVEDVELRILLSGSPYQSVVEGFPSMLGRFLPRLRSVTIISSSRPLNIHRYFSIRRVLLHTVTVLEVSNILFDKDVTFEWFIAPFPSLRLLDLWSVTWKVASDPQGTLPALTELELRLRGKDMRSAWRKDNREAYENLINASRRTLRSLAINVFSLYILTSLHDYKSEDFQLSALEVLSLEVHTHYSLRFVGKDGKEVPFSQCLSDITPFLSRVNAKKTRVLNLTFEIDPRDCSMTHDEFVDYLRSDVRKGLEDLVTGDHFPALQAINITFVGAHKALVPMWQGRFESCFPLLAKRRLLHVKEHIPKETPRHRT